MNPITSSPGDTDYVWLRSEVDYAALRVIGIYASAKTALGEDCTGWRHVVLLDSEGYWRPRPGYDHGSYPWCREVIVRCPLASLPQAVDIDARGIRLVYPGVCYANVSRPI